MKWIVNSSGPSANGFFDYPIIRCFAIMDEPDKLSPTPTESRPMPKQPKKPKTPPADNRVLVFHHRGSPEEAAYLRDLAKLMGLGVTETYRLALGRLGKAQGLNDYPTSRSVGRPATTPPPEPAVGGDPSSEPSPNGD